MASFNRIIMVGNLTRDPEYKQVSQGQALCRLSIASNRQFKNKQTGVTSNDVCFIDVDVWGPQAESCKQYLQKGRPILVEGRLKLDTWKEADGQTVRRRHLIVAERIVFLGSNQHQSDVSDDTIGVATTSGQFSKSSFGQSSKSDSTGDMQSSDLNFKDELPFEEDLPF